MSRKPRRIRARDLKAQAAAALAEGMDTAKLAKVFINLGIELLESLETLEQKAEALVEDLHDGVSADLVLFGNVEVVTLRLRPREEEVLVVKPREEEPE